MVVEIYIYRYIKLNQRVLNQRMVARACAANEGMSGLRGLWSSEARFASPADTFPELN